MSKENLSLEANELLDSFPMSIRQFNLLLRKLGTIDCKRTLEHTLTFIEKNDLNEETVISWINQNFGKCDCSIALHGRGCGNELMEEVLCNDHGSDAKEMKAKIEILKTGLVLTAPIKKSEIVRLFSHLDSWFNPENYIDDPQDPEYDELSYDEACSGNFEILKDYSLDTHYVIRDRIVFWAKRHECFCDCEFHRLLKGVVESLAVQEYEEKSLEA